MTNPNAQVIAEFRRHGRVGGELAGAPLLLLSTYRPDARIRTVPLVYSPAYAGHWLVFAAFAGADHDPAWCMDLRHEPAAKIEVADPGLSDGAVSEFWVEAVFLTDAVRAHYYEQQCAAFPRYRDYAGATTREIPVIALHPARRWVGPSRLS